MMWKIKKNSFLSLLLVFFANKAVAGIDCADTADATNRQKINAAFAVDVNEGLNFSRQFAQDCPQKLLAQLNLANASRAAAKDSSQTALQQSLYAQAVDAYQKSLTLISPRQDKAFAVIHGGLATALLGLNKVEEARVSGKVAWSYFYAPDKNRANEEPADIKETRMEIERRFKLDAASLGKAVELGKNAIIVEASSVDIRVGFDFNKATLSPLGKAQVQQLVEVLRQQESNLKFTLVGHTDDVGTDVVNNTLSLERARSVAFELQRQLPELAGRLQARGEGKTKPLFNDTSESARALNRRVELQVIVP